MRSKATQQRKDRKRIERRHRIVRATNIMRNNTPRIRMSKREWAITRQLRR